MVNLRRHLSQAARQAILLFFLLITIAPLYFVVVTSLKTNEEFYTNLWLPGETLHFENYSDAWTRGRLGEYFGNSLLVVITSVILVILIALPAGYALARLRLPGSRLLVTFLAATLMIPAEATLVPLFVLMASFKLINTRENLIIVYVGWSLALTSYIFRNYFLTLPEDIAEAARVDGASEAQVFVRVMLPMSWPAIATGVIFNFLFIWGEFLWALISTRSDNVRTIPLGLFRFEHQFGTNWVQLSAAIATAIVPLVVVFVFFQRYFIRGLTAGAVKA